MTRRDASNKRTRRRGAWPVCSSGCVEPGQSEVEKFGLADTELVHLVHLCLQLRRWLLAFAFACRLFGGEVQGHGVGPALMSHHHAADDVRPERGPDLWVLCHEFPGACRI